MARRYIQLAQLRGRQCIQILRKGDEAICGMPYLTAAEPWEIVLVGSPVSFVPLSGRASVQGRRQMVTHTIYRIQDNDGRGPWKPGFSHKWVETRNDHDNLPPWYIEFGPVHLNAISGCAVGTGCMTIDQLRRWFTESEYKTLLSCGYKAVKMTVGRILASSSIQCVFERHIPLDEEFQEFPLYD